MEAKQGGLSRTSLYKALALVAWAQQGKELSPKLLDNFSGDGTYFRWYVCVGLNLVNLIIPFFFQSFQHLHLGI